MNQNPNNKTGIPVWNSVVGEVDLRSFDQGVMTTLNAIYGGQSADAVPAPCYTIPVLMPDGTTRYVPAYFDQPEAIFQKMIFPFVSIHREDVVLAMHRWMNVGQLEYKAGVSGTQISVRQSNGSVVSGFSSYQAQIQPFPYDIPYTISCFDRYENLVQPILKYILRSFPPLGKLFVSDSLGLPRTYEAYQEGSIANLQELIDPVQRVRGYALSIRVEGELDLADPYTTSAVSGITLDLHRS